MKLERECLQMIKHTYICSLMALSKIIWLTIFEFSNIKRLFKIIKIILRLFCETSLARSLPSTP